MKCVVVIPVGPGHTRQATYAVESVMRAWEDENFRGPFTELQVAPQLDTAGELGRSKARNNGLSIPADYHFLLDADDRMLPTTFSLVDQGSPATFGMVCLDGVVAKNNIVPVTRDLLFKHGAVGTLSMGCFLRGDLGLRFDENIDVGEDFDFYMRLPGFTKLPVPLVSIGYWHTESAGGPRTSKNTDWGKACRAAIEPYRLRAHTLPEPNYLREVEVIADVGPGMRPIHWFPTARRHVCIEPHVPYAKALKAAGYVVWENRIQDSLGHLEDLRPDTVVLLDVIEHLEKGEAHEVLARSCEAARVQVIVYTPYGFVPQEKDAWKLGGDFWQTHRSGWTPEDFAHNWHIQLFQPPPKTEPQGFYAVLTK